MSRQERATATRSALIRSAAHVFDREGYAQARLDLVSQGAGVSRGALSFHFPNKEMLADAVEAAASGILRRTTSEIYRGRHGALQALIDSTHALAALLCGDPVVRGGFRLSCDSTHGGHEDLRRQWERYVLALLGAAAVERELRDGVPQRDMADTIVAATIGFQVLGQRDERWMSAPVLTRFWLLLLPWLAAPGVLPGLRAEGSVSVRGL
jgi:AcrR family transcriptional regulator